MCIRDRVAGVLAAATPGVAVLACAVAPAVAATTVEDDGGEVMAEPPLHAATMTATIGPTIQLIRMRMASSALTRCRQRVSAGSPGSRRRRTARRRWCYWRGW